MAEKQEIIKVTLGDRDGNPRIVEFIVDRGKGERICRTFFRTNYFLDSEEAKKMIGVVQELKVSAETFPMIPRTALALRVCEQMRGLGETVKGEVDNDIALPEEHDDALIGRERGTWLK